jgi:hypothetical protein
MVDGMPKVYVLLARYSDGSGYEVLRVLEHKQSAEIDAAMLNRAQPAMAIDVLEVEYDISERL